MGLADEIAAKVLLGLGATQTPAGKKQPSISVGQLYMKYRGSKPRGLAWRIERQNLRYFILRYWRRPCDSLTQVDWDRHRELRRGEKTRQGRPPAESTMNVDLTRTKQMFWYGVNAGLIEKHPFPKAKFVKAKKRRGTAPNAAQVNEILAHVGCLRYHYQQITVRALVCVMADTGARISEAMGLRWDRITLRWTTTVLGKGDKTRPIAFTSRAREALSAIPRHPSSPYVFTNYTSGQRWKTGTVRGWFYRVVDECGLNDICIDGDARIVPHHLRHSFATEADRRGATLTQIQHALGHASAKTTELYLHKDKENNAVEISRIMEGGRRLMRRGPRKSSHEPEKNLDTSQGSRAKYIS